MRRVTTRTDTPNNQLLLSGVPLQLLGGATLDLVSANFSTHTPTLTFTAGWHMEKCSAVITVDVWDIISQFYGGTVAVSPNSWLILAKEM